MNINDVLKFGVIGWLILFVIAIAIFIGIIVFVITLISNPHAIGEFFGNIVSGFKSV